MNLVYYWLFRHADEERRAQLEFELLAPIPGLDESVFSSRTAEQELDDFLSAMSGMG